MGQYRLCVIFKLAFWFGVSVNGDPSVSILFPFVRIYIGLGKDARGVEIFGHELGKGIWE